MFQDTGQPETIGDGRFGIADETNGHVSYISVALFLAGVITSEEEVLMLWGLLVQPV